jgi:hypothetical protein
VLGYVLFFGFGVMMEGEMEDGNEIHSMSSMAELKESLTPADGHAP